MHCGNSAADDDDDASNLLITAIAQAIRAAQIKTPIPNQLPIVIDDHFFGALHNQRIKLATTSVFVVGVDIGAISFCFSSHIKQRSLQRLTNIIRMFVSDRSAGSLSWYHVGKCARQ